MIAFSKMAPRWRRSVSLVHVVVALLLLVGIESFRAERHLQQGNTTASNAIFAPNSAFKLRWNRDICINRPEGKRCYDLYIPFNVTDNPALVLNFHSRNSNKLAQQGPSQLRELAKKKRTFVVAFPDGYKNAWNVGLGYGDAASENIDDVGFVKAMIDHIKDNMIINPRKIYATGYSNGGALSYYLSYRAPEYVAAVASLSYGFNEYLKQDAIAIRDSINSTFRPIPVLSINGYNDQLNCWNHNCLFNLVLDPSGNTRNSKSGWHKWALVNGCKWNVTTIAERSWSLFGEDLTEYQWIKAYQQCPGGVEVRQILNSRNHGGEWFGKNFYLSQGDYNEEILEFLYKFSIPEATPVTIPQWWTTLQ